jgi:hypothetical protein
MFKTTAYAIAGAAAIAAALAVLPVQSRAEDAPAITRTIFACQARGSVDIAMRSRYELRSTGRKKFTAEFQSATDPRFVAGGRLGVKVDGVRVGTVILDALTGGGVIGDLNFDTVPQIDAKPFPANWPAGVGGGSEVDFLKGLTVVLGCTLRRL